MERDDILHIMNLLRKGTITWSGRKECFRRHRRKVFVRFAKNGNAIYKFEWHCSKCKEWFKDPKALEMDHIKEIGGHQGDWNVTVPAIFCEQSNLTLLCVECHLIKTTAYNSARTKYKRKNKKGP